MSYFTQNKSQFLTPNYWKDYPLLEPNQFQLIRLQLKLKEERQRDKIVYQSIKKLITDR